MPKRKNWSADSDPIGEGASWTHDHLPVGLAIFETDDDTYRLETVDLHAPHQRHELTVEDTVTEAKTWAREWMKHHPFPPYHEMYDDKTDQFFEEVQRDDYGTTIDRAELGDAIEQARLITTDDAVKKGIVYLEHYSLNDPDVRADERGLTGQRVSYDAVRFVVVWDTVIVEKGQRVDSDPGMGPHFVVKERELSDEFNDD